MNMLFLEDDLIIRDGYRPFLQHYFQYIYEANDGLEALELFKKNKIDFILADIQMQHLNGLEFVKIIRQTHPHIKVVIFSAYDDKSYLLDAIKLNLEEYLIKPVAKEKFKECINSVVEKIKQQKQYSPIVYLTKNYEWDMHKKILYHENHSVTLTKNELHFFEFFCTSFEHTFTLEQISYVLFPMEEFNENKIRMLIKRIRKKTHQELLKNHYNMGFYFNLDLNNIP